MAEYMTTSTETLTLHERAQRAVAGCPLHADDPDALKAVLADVRAQQRRAPRTLPAHVMAGIR